MRQCVKVYGMARDDPVAPGHRPGYRVRMDPLAAGFWGAFFGTAALMIAGAVAAYVRDLKRVALMVAFGSVLFMTFSALCLGLWPLDEANLRRRAQPGLFLLCAVLLGHMVLAMIGHMRDPQAARRWRTALYGFGIVVGGTAWLLPASQGFAVDTAGGFVVGAVALALCVRRARRGDRLAGLAIVGVLSICVSTAMLTWIALDAALPWTVHAVGATAGVVYLSVIAVVMWLRFSYLIELRRVMQHGAAYDPITRMRTHSETGKMVGLAFFDESQQGKRVGVLAISISNLLSLEKLHGRAAANHGLFVSAGRLRRSVPGGVECGRLGEDGFLVLVRDARDIDRLVQLGHLIVERMSGPVALSTSTEPDELESGQANWVAQVGVGIVVAGAAERPSSAIAQARSMSRAAWGFPSRVAWQDPSGHMAEAPALETA
jgi:GGDEF domain-containing protein